MYRPNTIANYFIKKYGSSEYGITPMKLVKLVYIAHGWYLGASDNQPLINENPQAWQYGPVIPEVYHTFKEYESSPIKKPCAGVSTDELDSNIPIFLDAIWKAYGKYSGIQLSSLTHQEGTPWYRTWYEFGGKDQRDKQIPTDLIHEHYKEKLARLSAK